MSTHLGCRCAQTYAVEIHSNFESDVDELFNIFNQLSWFYRYPQGLILIRTYIDL